MSNQIPLKTGSKPNNRKIMAFFRRQYIVDKKSQYGFLIYVLAIGALFTAYNSITVWLWQTMLGSSASLAELPLGRATIFIGAAVGGALLILAFATVGANVLSNRLAGPVWRLQKHMTRVVETGEIAPISFRSTDHFPELADSYNRLLVKLSSADHKPSL